MLFRSILRDNNLDVTNEEIREQMKQEVMQYFGQMGNADQMDWIDGYLDRMMKDEKHVDATYRRIISEKMFTWAAEQVKPKDKKVTPEELNALQHHHHH